VAPVGIDGDQRAGRAATTPVRDEQHPVPGHGVLHAIEEVAVQVRRRMMGRIRAHIAIVKEVPQRRIDLRALVRRERHAGFGDTPALLRDLLALVALQPGDEFVEIRVPGRRSVEPVELHRLAQHPSFGRGGLMVGVVHEQQVR
jgi:hypothetical protein